MPETSVRTHYGGWASPSTSSELCRGLTRCRLRQRRAKPLPSLDLKIFRDGRKPAPHKAFTLEGAFDFPLLARQKPVWQGGYYLTTLIRTRATMPTG